MLNDLGYAEGMPYVFWEEWQNREYDLTCKQIVKFDYEVTIANMATWKKYQNRLPTRRKESFKFEVAMSKLSEGRLV